jgi:UDP:flavonoid glycosyltransferase YjiC (YdhE family)
MIPPLKLAKALKLRGHRVYYVGFTDFEEYVRSQGLEYIPILEQRYPKGYLNDRAGKQSRMKLDRLSLMSLEARESNDNIAFNPLEELEKEIARVFQIVEPDLFIVDNMLRDLALMAAQKLGAPVIILSLHLDEARIGLGGPGYVPPTMNLPVVVLCPKQIDFSPTPKSSNHYYLEASIELERKEAYAFPRNALDETRPLIYCSFGSQCHQFEQTEALFRTIIAALRERPEWQLVLAIGPYLNIDDYQPAPENVQVVSWAPQLEMLSRASMMITHGGLGAVKECIFFGVPMIVFPDKWDHPNHAARVVYHGLGVRANIRDRSVRQVHSLIDAVDKNPMFKSRIAVMSKTFREIENSGIGVRTVEKLLAVYRDKRNVKRDLCAAEADKLVT